MKQAFVCISVLVLIGCNHQGQEKDLADKKNTDILKENTVIVNLLNGDTIETGKPLPFDPVGIPNENSKTRLFAEGADYNTDTTIIPSNKGNIVKQSTAPFLLDSATYISTEDTAIDPPRELVIDPLVINATEPERKKVLSSIYKDNAQFDIRYFGSDQGLPSNTVLDIVKDNKDIMWIATEKGLCKYDGRFLSNYSTASGLSEDYITCVTIDHDQNIWMGTRQNGIIKYDGHQFFNYNLDSISLNKKVNDIAVDKENNIWGVMEFGGVFSFQDSVFYSWMGSQGIYTNRPTTSITVDNQNRKWITGFGVGLYVFDDENRIFKQNQIFNPTSTYINNCVIDNEGNPLFSLWRSRVAYANGDSLSLFKFEDIPQCPLIVQTAMDEDGGFWSAAYGAGVYYWNPSTNEVEFYGPDQGLSTEYVVCIYADEFDGIWVGTDGGGLCHIQRNSFKSLNEFNGLKDQMVYEVVEDKNGAYYYATQTALVKQSGDTLIKYLVGGNNLQDVMVLSDGSIWQPNMNGGSIWIKGDKCKGMGNQFGAPFNPTAMDTTSDGHLWIVGDNASLAEVGDSAIYNYSYENGLHITKLRDICITDNDEIWLAAESQGVMHIVDDQITYYTTKEGLASNLIHEIKEDNTGRIWVTTEKGLNYFENGSIKKVENQLLQKNILGLAQDNNNRYWVTTDEGLICMVPKIAMQEQWNEKDFNFHLIDKKNGLINVNFLKGSVFIDSKNRLMAGNNGGISIIDLENIQFDRELPGCYLSQIGINGIFHDYRNLDDEWTAIETGEMVPFQNYPKELSLPHDMNHLTFEFSGVNWNDPHALDLYYYLEGYETDWNKSREENIADYRNLSYGDYTFHLKSVNRDGLESEEFTYAFTINRPWWHTWWARILYVLVFGGTIYLIIRRRTEALKKRQEELESEVARATIKITAQKEQAERQKTAIEKAHNELNIKNQEVLDSINYAKRIQSAILPSDKTVQENLPNNFVLYKPKDIVAGDFYWLEPASDAVYFAAADCTGHGVPGAMVSVICNNALNRSVRLHKLDDPAKILDMTRQIVLEEFGQSEEGVNDGMDIAICKLSREPDSKGEYTLEYSGAHNPLWVIQKDDEPEEGYSLQEIKGDKQPIGKFHDPKPFNKHTLKLKKGDCFYIFTDGFSDQFGGDKGKKFKTANFKRLLVKVQGQDIVQQGKLIDNMFEEWKSDFEQLDDVCVIGVQL